MATGGGDRHGGGAHDRDRSPLAVALVWPLGLVVAGAMFVGLFPRFSAAAEANLGEAPWRSLGLGVAALLAVPPLVLALLITVIGLPVALALIALHALLLLAGCLAGAGFIGERLARALTPSSTPGTPWRIGATTAAVAALALVQAVPFFGGVVALAVLLPGCGAVVLQLLRQRAGRT